MSTVEEQPTAQANGASAGQIPVMAPATGEVITHVPDMDAAQIEGLVDRARAAQPGWQALGFEGRARYMLKLKEWFVENKEEVLETLIQETGKTREDALIADWVYVADSFSFWAKRAEKYLGDEKVRSHSPFLLGKKLIVRYEPVGVVGVIGPWNFPLALCIGDAIPALMAGNYRGGQAERGHPAHQHADRPRVGADRRAQRTPTWWPPAQAPRARRWSTRWTWSCSPAPPPRARRSWPRLPRRSPRFRSSSAARTR